MAEKADFKMPEVYRGVSCLQTNSPIANAL